MQLLPPEHIAACALAMPHACVLHAAAGTLHQLLLAEVCLRASCCRLLLGTAQKAGPAEQNTLH
jgi:hypothetical protein